MARYHYVTSSAIAALEATVTELLPPDSAPFLAWFDEEGKHLAQAHDWSVMQAAWLLRKSKNHGERA